MKTPWSRPLRVPHAFTLVEILVVVAILALLAGLGTGMVKRGMEAGKKTRTKADMMALISALKAYKMEYEKLPFSMTDFDASQSDQGESNCWYSGERSKILIRILSGDTTATFDGGPYNPKGVRFFEGGQADGDGKFTGKFVDPWGNQYAVKMDLNNSGSVEYYTGNETIKQSILVISFGPNTKQENPENKTCDDVFSWR